jgi:hypothetical protein
LGIDAAVKAEKGVSVRSILLTKSKKYRLDG